MAQGNGSTVQEELPNSLRATEETSIVRGGPFYRVQNKAHLLTPERWNLGRRVTIAICGGWLPLFLLTFFLKTDTLRTLLTDYSLNVRMLIAVPVFLAGQVMMENVFRMIIQHIRAAGLLTPADQASIDQRLARLSRLSDSVVAEIILLVLVYIRIVTIIETRMNLALPWALSAASPGFHISAAGWYYILVSQPLYQFLLAVSLWKWFLWICFLFRLSRLDLQLVPTHPDKHAGLGFLGMTPLAITPTVLIASAAIGSTWRSQILTHQAHLMDFKIDAIVLLFVMLIAAVAPLCFFVPRLIRIRRQGILQYGVLGQIHSVDFHRKWVLRRPIDGEEFLTAPEISTLTDYATSYENVEGMKPFPLDTGAMVGVVIAILVAMLPVVLTEIPLVTIVKGLLSAVK